MCNRLQFSQAAIQSEISDGDYRTYMTLCSLAFDNYHETGQFSVDLTYADIGQSHSKPLSVAGVRSRINRLVRAGLVTRSRIDSKRWQTIPSGDNAALIPSRVVSENTQAAMAHNTQPQTPLPPVTPTPLAVAMPSTQGVTTDSTKPLSLLPATTPMDLPVADEDTHATVSDANGNTQPAMTVAADNTQISLTVAVDDTQTDVQVAYQDELILVYDSANNLLGLQRDGYIQTERAPLEEENPISGKELINMNMARRRLIRAAIERAEAVKNGEIINQMGVAAQNSLSLINDHDDINKQSNHDQDQKQSSSNNLSVVDNDELTKEGMLATVLANLPQPMTPDGIVECTTDPELCAAWLDYATAPVHGVRNPAAYVRKGIRSGHYPPKNQQAYISKNSPIYQPTYADVVKSKPSAV